MLERVTYSDWTDTMLAAYQRADLNEYERNQLSVEDIEGVNFLPLVWLFLGRVSVYTQFYGVFLFEGALLVEVAMLVVPFVVGVGYLGWRSYQFQNVPMLTYVGQSVQDVSATTEEPSDIEDMETVPVGSEDGEGGGEGAEQGFGEW
jgi:hypothetical protein